MVVVVDLVIEFFFLVAGGGGGDGGGGVAVVMSPLLPSLSLSIVLTSCTSVLLSFSGGGGAGQPSSPPPPLNRIHHPAVAKRLALGLRELLPGMTPRHHFPPLPSSQLTPTPPASNACFVRGLASLAPVLPVVLFFRQPEHLYKHTLIRFTTAYDRGKPYR